MILLVQCVIHPSFDSGSSKNWTFAACAYAICWASSAAGVWLGWELGYEYWRRWRLPRPAIEPIYLSLPATLHLALSSFDHFVFLAYIRASPLDTPHALDIVPETCYALVQLTPGLITLIPRAAIAVVMLTSFSAPSPNLQTPFGGTDQAHLRDKNFFRSRGDLTRYSRVVLWAFVSCIGLRLLLVVGGGLGLWLFSQRPLGGLTRHRFERRAPKSPRRPDSSPPAHDPNTRSAPRKTWEAAENGFNWAWRERTRARIQDAFELCMVRGSAPRSTETPWDTVPATSLPLPTTISVDQSRIAGTRQAPVGDNIESSQSRVDVLPSPIPSPTDPILPSSTSHGIAAVANASKSTQDIFYTPISGSLSNVTEFGVRRRSQDSEESVADDSTALLSDKPRHSRENLSSTHSQKSLRLHSNASGGALSRVRSASISLLRERVNQDLLKRARSGTVLSSNSRCTEIGVAEQIRALIP
jgi:hypothetical protein